MSVEVDYRSKRFWVIKQDKKKEPGLTGTEQEEVINKFVKDFHQAFFNGLKSEFDKIPDGLTEIITR